MNTELCLGSRSVCGGHLLFLAHGLHGCPLSFYVRAVWYVGDGGWHSWRMMEPD